jgi:hypothetical protein
MTRILRRTGAALFAAAALLSPGCASVGKPGQTLNRLGLAKPVQALAAAEATHLERDGMPAHQGLMVKTHFFSSSQDVPVKVKGTVVVNVYDMNHGEQGKPAASLTVPPDRLEVHYRKDFIGPSYSFWVPYEPPAKAHVRIAVALHNSGGALAAAPIETDLMPLKEQLASAQKKSRQALSANFEIITNKSDSSSGTQVAQLPVWSDGARPVGVFAPTPKLLVPAPRADAKVLPVAHVEPDAAPPRVKPASRQQSPFGNPAFKSR